MTSSQLTELLVRIRLHLLAIGGQIPAMARADYQECTNLLDQALLMVRDSGQHISQAAGLTPREGQILHLLQHGHSNQQIAMRMGITAGTVKTYLKSIYTKLGVQNRTQAALALHQPQVPDGGAQ